MKAAKRLDSAIVGVVKGHLIMRDCVTGDTSVGLTPAEFGLDKMTDLERHLVSIADPPDEDIEKLMS